MAESKTILVVDDDQELRQGLQAVLQEQGYRTLEAANGLEAMHLIGQNQPDLVILDMMMPQLGGFPVLEHYRDKTDAPPFIMITANESPNHRTQAEQAGAVAYLKKPFSLEHLLQRVEGALAAPQPAQEPAEAPSPRSRTILCRCPGCGARGKAPVQMLGQTRPCPRCGSSISIRPLPPEDAGSMLVLDDLLT